MTGRERWLVPILAALGGTCLALVVLAGAWSLVREMEERRRESGEELRLEMENLHAGEITLMVESSLDEWKSSRARCGWILTRWELALRGNARALVEDARDGYYDGSASREHLVEMAIRLVKDMNRQARRAAEKCGAAASAEGGS